MSKARKLSLVLSGGGARGAYQVGVVTALSDILRSRGLDMKIDFFSGVSAGAINASHLAAHCHNLHEGIAKLKDLWADIHSENVFRSDPLNIGRIGLQWMGELSLGALTGTTPGRALLDTSPLRDLLDKNLDYAKIDENLKAGHLSALAVTAVDYQTSHSVTFVHGQDDLPTWNKASRLSEKADIRSEHIMASAAIPLLFPPVKVDERWFGDGCVRNAHPCAPSIYMGAEKLIVVGVRHQEKLYNQTIPESDKAPSVARVINVLLNAVLLDGIELDVERMDRINELVKKLPPDLLGSITYKPIDSFWIAPSADLGEIAARKSSRLPRIIRYLIKGLGSLDEAREVVSYLLFDPSYCAQLIDIGYEDAMKQQDVFLKFYESE